MQLKIYVRVGIYQLYGWIYGVDFSEIKIGNLNQFRTFNSFFTRELKDDARTIENAFDEKTLCSPCDGVILTNGVVNSLDGTIDFIKGHSYRLDEFLFGYKS